MSDRVRTIVVVIVAAVWALNFTAPIVVHTFHPAPELNVAFMAIIAAVTATSRKGDKPDEKAKTTTESDEVSDVPSK